MQEISLIVKLISLLSIVFKNNPLNAVAQAHIEAAVDDSKHIIKEANPQETLNRIITHLTSAYQLYKKTIWSWQLGMGRKHSLWYQYKKHNCICLSIANIYFITGNTEMVYHWLFRMSPKGPWEDLDVDIFSYENMLGKRLQDFKSKVSIPSNALSTKIKDYEMFWDMVFNAM